MIMQYGFVKRVCWLVVVLLVPSGLVQAQAMDTGMMMQQLQEMQRCMASIDQAELSRLEQRARSLQTEIQGLCAKGNEAKARQQAIAFAQEASRSKPMQQIKSCTSKMGDFGQNMPNPLAAYEGLAKEAESVSICQGL